MSANKILKPVLALMLALIFILSEGKPAIAYNADVHYDLTYVLAIEAKYSSADAAKIALCDQGVDEDPLTDADVVSRSPKKFEGIWPVDNPDYLKPLVQNFRYHFVEEKTLSTVWNTQVRESKELCDLGVFLHALQDNFSHRLYLARGEHFIPNRKEFETDKTYAVDYTRDAGYAHTKDNPTMARAMAFNVYRLLVLYRWRQKLDFKDKTLEELEKFIAATYPEIEQRLDLLRWIDADRGKCPYQLDSKNPLISFCPFYVVTTTSVNSTALGQSLPAKKEKVASLEKLGAHLGFYPTPTATH
jgi:hypothetical protein